MADDSFRKQDRPADSKTFALSSGDLAGDSKTEMYNKVDSFKSAKEAYDTCLLYATAYNETLLKRLEAERPEFYEENELSKAELVAHLVNNMCLPFAKFRGRVFRDATAQLKEKEHLNDHIRRLTNGGDRFHPYL